MKIKPNDLYPGYDKRIDGMFFQHSGPTKIARVWRYPNERPSSRFSAVNDQVLQLTRMYEGSSPAIQEAWRTHAADYEWTTYCNPAQASYVPWDSFEAGVRSYLATNLAQWSAGYPTVLSPGVPSIEPNGDFAVATNLGNADPSRYPLICVPSLHWEQPGLPFLTFASALVYLYCPRNDIPSPAPVFRFRFDSQLNVANGIDNVLYDQFSFSGQVTYHCWLQAAFLLLEPGFAPFAWVTAGIRNERIF